MPPCCLHINSKFLLLVEKLPQLIPKITFQHFLSTRSWGGILANLPHWLHPRQQSSGYGTGASKLFMQAAQSTTFPSKTTAWRKLFGCRHTFPVSGLSGLSLLSLFCASPSSRSLGLLYSQQQMWVSNSLRKYKPPGEKPIIHSGSRERCIPFTPRLHLPWVLRLWLHCPIPGI